MIQDMASQKRMPLAGAWATATSFSIASLESASDMFLVNPERGSRTVDKMMVGKFWRGYLITHTIIPFKYLNRVSK